MAEKSRTIAVRFVSDPEERAAISAAVLAALPDWFGIPESTAQYVSDSRSQPFWAAEAEGQSIGFLALKKTSPVTAEIAVMGVLPEYHRSGAGRMLADAAQDYARADGCRFMQVKTVQEGHYDEYDRTNAFYKAIGFAELECFPTLWDEWNPCQVLVKDL
mgnify:FL=1